jgi:prepilin-type N-terminal cleavage/methylation domain-containing protein
MKSTFGHGASTNRNQRAQQSRDMRERELGFTLIELVIAIVLVGILSAVAIVGLSGVTQSGNKSACKTALASAQAAAATYYANTGAYPTTFTAMTGYTPPVLTVPSTVTFTPLAAATVMSASGWSVTIAGGGGITPSTYAKTGGGAACT